MCFTSVVWHHTPAKSFGLSVAGGGMRLGFALFISIFLSACGVAQTDHFSVRQENGTVWIYPPGPLANEAEPINVVVAGLVDLESWWTCSPQKFDEDKDNVGFAIRQAQSGGGGRHVVITLHKDLRKNLEKARDKIERFVSKASTDGTFRCLREGSEAVIVQAVLESLPVSIDDSFKRDLGLNTEGRYVDLIPGQEICVQYTGTRFRMSERTVPTSSDGPASTSSDGPASTNSNGNRQGSIDPYFGAGPQHCYRLQRAGLKDYDAPLDLTFSPFLHRFRGLEVPSQGAYSVPVAGAAELANTTKVRCGSEDDEDCRRLSPVHRRPSPEHIRYRLYLSDKLPEFDSYKQPNPKELPLLVRTTCPGAMLIFDWYKKSENRISDEKRISDVCQTGIDRDTVEKILASLEPSHPEMPGRFKACAGLDRATPVSVDWDPYCYWFSERGIPVPHIDVTIDGQRNSIELGTTVWHVLERQSSRPYFSAMRREPPFTTVSEAVSEMVARENSGFRLRRRFRGTLYPVRFDELSLKTLMIPLLPGDEVKQ